MVKSVWRDERFPGRLWCCVGVSLGGAGVCVSCNFIHVVVVDGVCGNVLLLFAVSSIFRQRSFCRRIKDFDDLKV